MTLKIIGAGFGRTGTTSLQAALQELGFNKCYHMRENFKHPSHAALWNQAWNDVIAGRKPIWTELFAGYQATVDWPGCTYYKELMAAYPDAKVLLSVRDSERWYESTRDTIYQISKSWLLFLMKLLIPHARRLYAMNEKTIWQGTFQGKFEDQAYAIKIYEDHITAVKAYVPPEKLLIYSVKEGWGPLCRFLEVDVPETPFPHLNEKALMQRAMRWGPILILLILALCNLAPLQLLKVKIYANS